MALSASAWGDYEGARVASGRSAWHAIADRSARQIKKDPPAVKTQPAALDRFGLKLPGERGFGRVADPRVFRVTMVSGTRRRFHLAVCENLFFQALAGYC